MTSICNLVVLISGSGSNLQTLINGQQDGSLPINIKAVISNRSDAFGLERATNAGIPAIALAHDQFSDRGSFDQALMQQIDEYTPDLVVLAGFMRILTPELVAHYSSRMLNIHPSLLPKYQGLNTHQRALDAGDNVHGVTVHFVTEELDGGPAVIQATVPVYQQDSAEELAKRIQSQEHIIYPMAVNWYASQRLQLQGDRVLLDGELLPKHGHQINS